MHRPQFELYDVQADPHEGHNLADDPQYKELLAELIKELKEFETRTNDPWAIKWEYE